MAERSAARLPETVPRLACWAVGRPAAPPVGRAVTDVIAIHMCWQSNDAVLSFVQELGCCAVVTAEAAAFGQPPQLPMPSNIELVVTGLSCCDVAATGAAAFCQPMLSQLH